MDWLLDFPLLTRSGAQPGVPSTPVNAPMLDSTAQPDSPPLQNTNSTDQKARRGRWREQEPLVTLGETEVLAVPAAPTPDPSCVRIVDCLTDLCLYLEAPAERWNGPSMGGVTVAQRVAADVRREERATAIRYLQRSICHWIVTRALGMPAQMGPAAQAP